MVTFTIDVDQEIPITVRRILRVIEPKWNGGWAVQFGRYIVQFPAKGDMNFYQRLAEHGPTSGVHNTTYEYQGWPTTATFGLPELLGHR
jgi:hypothetical protein